MKRLNGDRESTPPTGYARAASSYTNTHRLGQAALGMLRRVHAIDALGTISKEVVVVTEVIELAKLASELGLLDE